MPNAFIMRRALAIAGALILTMIGFLPAHAETAFPAWSECREKCDKEWDNEVAKCRRGDPMYEVCKERAMDRYSKCLAKCPPEPPEPPCPR